MSNKSVQEIRSYAEKKERIEQIRNAIQNKAIQLADLTKTRSRSFTAFSKELLRTYQKNPKSNEQRLRELSQFLYRMSYQYKRVIDYYAEMIDLSCYSVVPTIDLSKQTSELDKNKYMKKYARTLKQIKKMNLQSEIIKALIIAWREDVFYGYTYEDNDSFFIMPLNGQYCRISSVNFDGTLNFAYDFSYFRANTEDLDYWDSEFNKKYQLYLSDPTTYKWQELDKNRIICLKVNIADTDLVIPPFIQLFNQIIDLIDLQDIQNVKDELSIYKLLVARMETLKGTDEPDDFSVDIDTALDYFRRFEDKLPDEVNACISPLPIDVIEFKGNTTEDTDMISNSMSNLFKAAGVSQILDPDKINNEEAFKAAILSDSLLAIKTLLPQIEKWHNRYLETKVSGHCPIKYIEVTPYIKDEVIQKYSRAAEYGVPVKMAYAALLGFDPYDVLSLTYLETECLDLSTRWTPLQSSHTQSGKQQIVKQVPTTEPVSEPANKTDTDEKEGKDE